MNVLAGNVFTTLRQAFFSANDRHMGVLIVAFSKLPLQLV